MSAFDRHYRAGFMAALEKISGMSLENLTQIMNSGQMEDELLPTVQRGLKAREEKPVVWGPKASPEGQNNGGLDFGMPATGAV